MPQVRQGHFTHRDYQLLVPRVEPGKPWNDAQLQDGLLPEVSSCCPGACLPASGSISQEHVTWPGWPHCASIPCDITLAYIRKLLGL